MELTADYDRRLGHVERQVDNLGQQLGQVQRSQGALDVKVSGVLQQLGDLGKKLDLNSERSIASQRTDWKTLAAWAAIIIGLMSTLGNLSLEPMRQNIRFLQDKTSDRWTRTDQREWAKEFTTIMRDNIKEGSQKHTELAVRIAVLESKMGAK